MTEGQRADVLQTDALVVCRPAAGLTLRVPPLRLPAGHAVALLGPSGAGKTTLLEGLLGLLGRGDGELRGARRFAGHPVPPAPAPAWRQWLRGAVAFVPQDARAALDPVQRLAVQAAELSGAAPAACAERLRALGEPEPEDVLARFPHQVSGGQAQRVLLAVALARAPALLVADEPTASLDPARQALLAGALHELRARGSAVLIATHDAAFVRALGAEPFTVGEGSVQPGWPPAPPWPARPVLPPAPRVLLRAHGLVVRRGARTVLRGVALAVTSGETVAVLGPSGSGKTTLLAALAGLVRPAAGAIEWTAGGRPQLLFQDAYASLTPGRTLRALARETAADRGEVDALAGALGLSADVLGRTARAMSGGQRRRAALLRALTVRPHVLLLDEPTASLDPVTAAAAMATVHELAAPRGAGCVLVTHDEELAHALAHRVLRLEDGALVAA